MSEYELRKKVSAALDKIIGEAARAIEEAVKDRSAGDTTTMNVGDLSVILGLLKAGATPHHSEPAREAVAFPAYGELPFSELGAAVKAAQFGAPEPYEFDPEFYPGHQVFGPINFNSLNRIVTWFVKRALSASPAPASSGGLEAVREAVKRLEEQERDSCWHPMYRDGLLAAIREISAALAAPAATGGPFGYVVCDHLGKKFFESDPGALKGKVAVYTHPAPSETGASLGVKVKALEWGDAPFKYAPFNGPEVVLIIEGHGIGRRFATIVQCDDGQFSLFCAPTCARFDTLDEAKAAAQADFETRIRAALEVRSDG